MTPNEYQQLALRTENTPPFIDGNSCLPMTTTNHTYARLVPMTTTNHAYARLVHAALGACTEVGELQDAIKKNLIYGKPLDGVNVMEECGDVLWYIALALDAVGYSMQDCMQRNIEKLRKRFPDKFTSMQALHRDLSAERDVLEGNPETVITE